MTGHLPEYYHGLDTEAIKQSIRDHIAFTLAKDQYSMTDPDRFTAVALSVRDRLIERWMRTQQTHYAEDAKRVYYLSMEFLLGRTLGNAVLNLDLADEFGEALRELGSDYEMLRESEWDAGLGNGGLGRLAACFLDSMATLELPAIGYGIRYEFGIFKQEIRKGAQVEQPDNWLRNGNPWEIPRPQILMPVHFYGKVIQYTNRAGRIVSDWVDTTEVMAMAYDTPVPGYGTNTVNTLRLWSAKSSREFELDYFNQGDYIQAVREKNESEMISKVLYPNDNRVSGKELRLKQEYFFVSASLQDIIRRYKRTHTTFDRFVDRKAIQLNDTHPAIAIAELMRLLVDIEGLEWEKAWQLTQATFGYTNHTVMPEALERWPASLLGAILPRHLQIVFEINHRFLNQVRHSYPNDDARAARMSLVEEPYPGSPDKHIRMAHLAIVGSHSVNGVSELHTEILKRDIFRDFYEMFPERFNNKTNGITPRRWLKLCNPWLSSLVDEAIGPEWVTDLERLSGLEKLVDDASFRERWREARRHAKQSFAGMLDSCVAETRVDLDSIFDVQVKRIHDYKRQLMNALHCIALYNEIRDDPDADVVPRTIVFAGKAAPGYERAKLTIRLVSAIGDVVNNDPAVRGKLRVLFVPNYGVSVAERIVPGTDLSEQISTAGYEASGTGNMKFALNGALTIGTLDGANVEIREEVGEENIFIFGLTAEEVGRLKPQYDPRSFYYRDDALRRALDMISSGYFSPLDRTRFHPIVDFLLDEGDPFMVLADFAAYIECQREVARVYRDVEEWTRRSIRNVAGMGRFSSDRTIAEYAREIWGVAPVKVRMNGSPSRNSSSS
jgi:starch phosphorylase